MTSKATATQLDQLNLETAAARNKAVIDHKVSLIQLHNLAKEKFSSDPQAARALRYFEESASAVIPAGISGATQVDLEIGRAVVACHIRQVTEKQFQDTAHQLTDAELGRRYLSEEVSEWEKVIIEGHLTDRYEEQQGEDALDEILEDVDGVEAIAHSFTK